MHPGSPDAVLASISQSTNELTQGWMRLLASAPAAADAPWLAANPSLQSSYLEKQSRLWNALLAGRSEAVAEPQPGDRRSSHPHWHENPYYNYLNHPYLLAPHHLDPLPHQPPPPPHPHPPPPSTPPPP